MSAYTDLAPCTYFGENAARVLRSVGWLDAPGFPIGPTEARVYHRLRELLVDPFQPAVAGGSHGCSLCQFAPERRGNANLFVPASGVIYVCPELIVHYMNAHHYQPPDEFSSAVLQCPDTRTIEYKKRLLVAGGQVLLDRAG